MRRTITGSLLLIIAVSYLLQITTVGYEDRFLLNRFYVENGEYYRLFTVALLHGGLWHLAFNLLALYALGTPLEHYFGKRKYLLILFVSLICGSTLSVLLNPAYGERAGVEWRSILIIVGLNFAIGFVLGGVDWRGHLGGLIGGALVTLTLNRSK